MGAAWEIRHVVNYFPVVIVNNKHGQRILKLAAMIAREVVAYGTESQLQQGSSHQSKTIWEAMVFQKRLERRFLSSEDGHL